MDSTMPFISEVWSKALLDAVSKRVSLLPAAPEFEREWYAHRRANARRVEIPCQSMSAEDACAAITAAAVGLQNTSVEWGDECGGPAVEGFAEGAICDYPSPSGPCQLLLGHPGGH